MTADLPRQSLPWELPQPRVPWQEPAPHAFAPDVCPDGVRITRSADSLHISAKEHPLSCIVAIACTLLFTAGAISLAANGIGAANLWMVLGAIVCALVAVLMFFQAPRRPARVSIEILATHCIVEARKGIARSATSLSRATVTEVTLVEAREPNYGETDEVSSGSREGLLGFARYHIVIAADRNAFFGHGPSHEQLTFIHAALAHVLLAQPVCSSQSATNTSPPSIIQID